MVNLDARQMTDAEAIAFMDEEFPGWREMTPEQRKTARNEKLDGLLDLMNNLKGKDS